MKKKRNVFKRTSAVFLTVAMVAGLLPTEFGGIVFKAVANAQTECAHIDDNTDYICDTCEAAFSGNCSAEDTDSVTWQLDINTKVLTISGTGAMEDYLMNSTERPWSEYKELFNSVVIEDGVTKIGSYAFYEYGGIGSVEIGKDVSVIGAYSFMCTSIAGTLVIPGNVSKIEQHAFDYNQTLEKVVLEEGVTYIGTEAFARNKKMVEVTLPVSVNEILSGAFFNCSDSLILSYMGNCAQWDSIRIMDNVYEIVLKPTSWKIEEDGHARPSADQYLCNENVYCIICDGEIEKAKYTEHTISDNYNNSHESGHNKSCINEGCTYKTVIEPHIYDDNEDMYCNICNYLRVTTQYGATLNCFGWSFNNIKDQLLYGIKNKEFRSVQVSPLQINEANSTTTFAEWDKMYEVSSYTFSENCVLGTKDEFENLCTEAGNNDIDVIVEVVVYTEALQQSDITSSVVEYLKECIDLGADGFCFVNADKVDATALPDNFWSDVVTSAKEYANGQLYCYCEVSDENAELFSDIMHVTNSYAGKVRQEVIVGNSPATYELYSGKIPADKTVVTPETREEFMTDITSSVTVDEIARTWALTLPQKGLMGVYFVRPDSKENLIGTSTENGWNDPYIVKNANQFNYFFREKESQVTSYSENFVVLERGMMGAIIVRFSDNVTNMNNYPITSMFDGSYNRNVYSTGSFYVTDGKLSGSVSNYSTEVVYNYDYDLDYACRHDVGHEEDGDCHKCLLNVGHTFFLGTCTECGVTEGDKHIYFDNSEMKWEKVYIYAWGGSEGMTWPGVEITEHTGDIYSYVTSGENVIFNDGYVDGAQFHKTKDIEGISNCKIYKCTGEGTWTSDENPTLMYDTIEENEYHRFNVEIASDSTFAAPATCTDNAKYYLCCEHCGAVGNSEADIFEISGTATGHTDENSDGYCDTCKAIVDGKSALYGRSITLGGELSVNFYTGLAADVAVSEATYMEFTVNGKTSTVYAKDLIQVTMEDGTKCYKFACNVNATQMADVIMAKLYYNNEVIRENTYSIKEYADTILADESYSTQKYGAEAVALVKAMLNYGGTAQTYFNYNKNLLANASMSEYDKTIATLEGVDFTAYEKVVQGGLEEITYYGTSTVLNSNTVIRHYFTLEAGQNITDYTFKLGEETLLVQQNLNGYYVDITDIAADKYNEMYVLTVTKTGAEDTLAVKFSVYTYIDLVMKAENMDSVKEVVKAAYWYNQKTLEYKNTI